MNTINNLLRAVFFALITTFIVLFTLFILANSDRGGSFGLIAILALLACLLGVALIVLTIRSKIQGKQKIFLLITGASVIGIPLFSVLHNVYYAFGIVTHSLPIMPQIYGIKHAAAFLIALLVCPLVFLGGVSANLIMIFKRKSQF